MYFCLRTQSERKMEVHNIGASNSVINQYVAEMRCVVRQKDPLRFRTNIERIGMMMAYEVSKTLGYKEVTVETPLGVKAVNVPADDLVVGTIMRAGLPMHGGVLRVFDKAENCFVSAFRVYNEKHEVEIRLGYAATPSLEGKVLILADPMLATGFSMAQTIEQLLKFGTPKKIHVLSIIAAQPGIDYLVSHPVKGVETEIWAASVDPELNKDAYIVPGLGDAGDLAYGVKL